MEEDQVPASKKKKRVVMMEPVYGNKSPKPQTADMKRPLTSKQDIPHMFLNQLM